MKSWYSASELIGQPGLPGTVQNVNAKAAREGWIKRPRAGRGGGKEYAVASLPTVTQRHLAGDPSDSLPTDQEEAPVSLCRLLLGGMLVWIGLRFLSAAQALLNEERTS
ncbi:DNA-binding protein [Thiocystis violascens]|uniref:Mu DNA-binding domain protein n=1 Tax=Thiocystis violascens (strain ATCC 17096 / DSM 198 / 6111) TaxID=765911 RepID=I3YGS4_THIV6|nr:DNA-binding protein [Thiocystis violascens]AFL76192.1 Mu DNA-binding domain protein [Thiocystis violascens DSM 198]